MATYSQSFLEDLKSHVDIVQVVQEYVPLRQVGNTYKGLCPFHAEKTPSFNVNRDKGYFHCFGCGVGGDAFKFVELQEKLAFPDVVKRMAQRFGVALPASEDAQRDRAQDAERETLIKIHELSAAYFRSQLESSAGRVARDHLRERALTAETMAQLGYGYAPADREGLKRRLVASGIPLAMAIRSGLILQRDDGQTVDRFRHRLMVPICRESGSTVAFGGRALSADQVPKYLNSPETPIYSKGRTLYGLSLTKQAIRKEGMAVLVEGYFDFAQAWQAGVTTVLATCGTALTKHQAQLLRRFAAKVVLSFDPDTAGQGAVVKSSELLVQENFTVNVAVLPSGQDPDTFVRRAGPSAYRERIATAHSYLDHLIEAAATTHDFSNPDSRRHFLTSLLELAAKIPDPAQRDQFADRLAHRAQIGEDVVRQEIRRAAVARRTTLPDRILNVGNDLKPAERDLLSALISKPSDAMAALAWLEDDDLDGLATERIFREARSLKDLSPDSVPQLLFERLSDQETGIVTRAAASGESALTPLTPKECARTLRRLRYERERAATQREIKQLQEQNAVQYADRIARLSARKIELARLIEELGL